MREQAGRIIHLTEENAPVRGCTISRQLEQGEGKEVSIFSLAEETGISAESYAYPKLIFMQQGKMNLFTGNAVTENDPSNQRANAIWTLASGDIAVTPIDIPVGMEAETDSVYVELGLGKENVMMNHILKAGEVFQMKELLPYQEGRIVNMDLVNDPKMKFVLMSFDAGTSLSEHAAPGEALVFALDGEAVIGYEGKEHVIKAGETFKFDKFGRHSVTANGRFKMALLLVFDQD